MGFLSDTFGGVGDFLENNASTLVPLAAGAIGGPGAAAGASALMGMTGAGMLSGGGFTPQAIAPFQPFNVQGPAGSALFSGQDLSLKLSPYSKRDRGQLFASMVGGPFGLTSEQQQVADMGSAFGNQAIDISGAGGGFIQDLGRQLAGTGQEFLQGARQVNPDAIAANQFQRMQALLAPQREKANIATENRLLRQGLLTSSGGADRMGALAEANRMQDISLAQQALQQGMDVQGQLFGRGLAGMQAGGGLFGQGMQQQLAGLGAGFGFMQAPVNMQQQALGNFMTMLGGRQSIQNQLLNQANLGFRGGEGQAQINAANAQMQNQAAMNQSDAQNALLQGALQAGMLFL